METWNLSVGTRRNIKSGQRAYHASCTSQANAVEDNEKRSVVSAVVRLEPVLFHVASVYIYLAQGWCLWSFSPGLFSTSGFLDNLKDKR